jgi:hypothetical protein
VPKERAFIDQKIEGLAGQGFNHNKKQHLSHSTGAAHYRRKHLFHLGKQLLKSFRILLHVFADDRVTKDSSFAVHEITGWQTDSHIPVTGQFLFCQSFSVSLYSADYLHILSQ